MIQRFSRHRTPEDGFTLVELLVVIIILGILAAVVVFAVGGIGDKGQTDACKIDKRTIRTAEEAYFAKNGEYGSETQLHQGGFLSEESTLHKVTLTTNASGKNTDFDVASDSPKCP